MSIRPFCTSKASYDAFKQGSGYTDEDDPDHIRCVHSPKRKSGEAKHRIRTVSAGSSEADGKNKKATFLKCALFEKLPQDPTWHPNRATASLLPRESCAVTFGSCWFAPCGYRSLQRGHVCGFKLGKVVFS